MDTQTTIGYLEPDYPGDPYAGWYVIREIAVCTYTTEQFATKAEALAAAKRN